MRSCSRTYFRLLALSGWMAIFLAFLFPGLDAYADTYKFSWTANHANDNVTAYEIYYRPATEGTEYNSCVSSTDIENVPLVQVYGEFDLEDIQEGYCFAIKAVDENGYRSDFPDKEIGRKQDACPGNPNDLMPDEVDCEIKLSVSFGDGDGGGGGGGGGCFLNQINNGIW